MEFSSWMELFLENPHKPFQKHTPAPDRLLHIGRKGAFWQQGYTGKALAFFGPLAHSGIAEVDVHTAIEHHLSASESSLNHPKGRDQGPNHLRRKVVPEIT